MKTDRLLNVHELPDLLDAYIDSQRPEPTAQGATDSHYGMSGGRFCVVLEFDQSKPMPEKLEVYPAYCFRNWVISKLGGFFK